MKVSNVKKVLLAEDDKFLAVAVGERLAREGLTVVRSSTGRETLAMVRSEHPDLVLLDLIMPGQSGFAVLEELRADPELKATPVIVLSNLGQESDIAKARGLGVLDYLVKSDVQLKDVIARVKNFLDGDKS